MINVQSLFPNALYAFRRQVTEIGDSVSETEIRMYVAGDGPVSAEYAEDPPGVVANPHRTKAWRLGRVKYFYARFKSGAPVDAIVVIPSADGGTLIFNGMHRLLGAAYAGVTEIACRAPRPPQG